MSAGTLRPGEHYVKPAGPSSLVRCSSESLPYRGSCALTRPSLRRSETLRRYSLYASIAAKTRLPPGS